MANYDDLYKQIAAAAGGAKVGTPGPDIGVAGAGPVDTVTPPKAGSPVPSAASPMTAAVPNGGAVEKGMKLNDDGTLSAIPSPAPGVTVKSVQLDPTKIASGAAIPSAAAVPSDAAAAGGGYPQPPEALDLSGDIGALYDAQLQAYLEKLRTGYDSTLAALDAAGAKLPGLYADQQRQLNADNERTRQAMNEQMAASGLNVGAGSQARLAQNANYLGSSAQIRRGQADAQAELDRQRAQAEADYQAAIRQALADGDYQKAMALAKEKEDYYNRQLDLWKINYGMQQDEQQRELDKAKILAGYGDFSGYEALYGKEAADQMKALWMAQNPQFAYMTGAMSAEDYYTLTGQWPSGYNGGGGYGGYTGGDTGTGGGPGGTLPPIQKPGEGASAEEVNAAMAQLGAAKTKGEFATILNQLSPAAYQALQDQAGAYLLAMYDKLGSDVDRAAARGEEIK